MLEPIISRDGEQVMSICDEVRLTDRLADVFRCRMEQLEAIHRWLTGNFQAVGILLQIPGAAEYRYQKYDTDADLWNLIWNPDPNSTLNILAATLERLDADELLRQVPGGDGFKRRSMSADVRVRIAERDRLGLLSIVADCLDRLLVVPNIPGQPESYGLIPEDEPKRTPRAKTRRAGRQKTKRAPSGGGLPAGAR